MEYVKIKGNQYPVTIDGHCGKYGDSAWNGRWSKEITIEMSYEEALVTFVNDVSWSIVHQPEPYVDKQGETITPDPEEYDNSEYCVAGSITDHRNGTVTVKMGKPTEIEILNKQLANAVTEEELEAAYTEGVNSL
jgi:hypothetical protein